MKSEFMEQMIAAMDSRMAFFDVKENQICFSKRLFEILRLASDEERFYKENPNKFVAFLEENSVEAIGREPGECSHLIGIIDTDEKYIMIHLFMAEDEAFGFIIDKTAQVYRDVSLLEELHKVRTASQIDGLTGLLNRSGFEQLIKKSLKSPAYASILCIFDVDNFKYVNDNWGHPVGDLVLKKFAGMLRNFFEEKALIGRLGGDEFVVYIYYETSCEDLAKMLKTFTEMVKVDFAREYEEMRLSVSVGAAMIGMGTNDYASLYRSADQALYKVKRSKKGGFFII